MSGYHSVLSVFCSENVLQDARARDIEILVRRGGTAYVK